MSNAALADRRRAATPAGLSTHLDIYVDRAENAELWDVDGKHYVDFAAGIAVLNVGHRHPKVMQRVHEQLDRFTHTNFTTTPYADYVELAEKLNKLVPGPTPKKTFFVSTGAEAVENAVKIARAATGRTAFISFAGGFHGRTMMAMTLTGKNAPYKNGFGPMVPEVFHLPFPTPFHGISEEDSIKALERLFKADVDPSRVAGLFVEPVQGEGGFYIASPSFLQQLRKICDQHGILLIVDEIQTGFARTGRMLAMEYAGIEPDLVTMAKGLGGGFPIAALTGKAALMDKAPAGGIGGTYAGSPVACSAGLAVLEIIEEEKLVERALEIGERAVKRLNTLAQGNEVTYIGEVRNLGAMIAVELVKDRASHEPAPELAKAVTQRAAELGVVVLTCGLYGNVVRLLPPLTIGFDTLDEGLKRLEQAFVDVAHKGN